VNEHPKPIEGSVKVSWEPLGQIEPSDLPAPSEIYPAPWAAHHRGNGHFDVADGQGRIFAHVYVWGGEDGRVFETKMKAAVLK